MTPAWHRRHASLTVEESEPTFFATPTAWRAWLQRNHGKRAALWVGFHKVGSGIASITWPESVDEALCFGWIDGVRHSIDEHAYKIRFTPRKPGSKWSRKNVERIAELTKLERMHAAGLAAFAARHPDKVATYAYEQSDAAELPPAFARRLQRNAKARAFFARQPPWYQRTSIRWVTSAKREETRKRRFETLLLDCAAGRTIKPLTRPQGRKK